MFALSHSPHLSPQLLSSPLPAPPPSEMSSAVDPSTIGLTPHDLSKLSKKDLAKHMAALQVMYTERGRKYGM